MAQIGASQAQVRWQVVDELQQFVNVTRKQAFQMVYDPRLAAKFHAVHSGGVREEFHLQSMSLTLPHSVHCLEANLFEFLRHPIGRETFCDEPVSAL